MQFNIDNEVLTPEDTVEILARAQQEGLDELTVGEAGGVLGDDEMQCVSCGCTDRHACPEGCYWVADNLCSACM